MLSVQPKAVRPMALTFGGRVPLEDVVGRDETVERLWSDLESNSIVISEVRRFGKSTILRLMESRVPTKWLCARTSVQGVRSTVEIIELTLQTLLEHAGLKEKAKQTITSVGKLASQAKLEVAGLSFSLGSEHKDNARGVFRQVLKSVNEQLKADNQYLAIIWDEFPDAVKAIADKEGKPAAEDVLAFFRASREDDSSERIRWVLTGSVGFHHVLKDLGHASSLVNDMQMFALEPITLEDSRWMVSCLLLGIRRDASVECIESLAMASGGIPFVLELMVKYIRDRNASLPETQEEARDLLIEAAANPTLGSNWAPLLERIGDYYGENRTLAEEVLDIVARGPIEFEHLVSFLAQSFDASLKATAVEEVMSLLIEDHYLRYEQRTGLYEWLHPALRIIWQARRRKHN